jgi:ATP-dependent DNA helicase RecQ
MAMLRDLRHQMGKKLKLAPYVIFQDPALEEMTVRYPITLEELTLISGVGPGKAQKYGKPFVELIASYVEENDIEREDSTVVRTVMKKSSNKVHIIQNIDKRLALESIAKAKGLSMHALIEEMETIVSSGTKLDINYHLDEVLDEDVLDEMMDYFRQAESDSLELANEEFGRDFSEDEIRLVRLKFLSEVAN